MHAQRYLSAPCPARVRMSGAVTRRAAAVGAVAPVASSAAPAEAAQSSGTRLLCAVRGVRARRGAAAQAALGGAQSGGAQQSARYNLDEASTAKGLTLPTLLTLLRVAAVPALVGVHFVKAPWAATASVSIFLVASLTDWLDGYLARKMNTTSAFGAFLDPVADKLMVAAALVLLSTQPPGALSAMHAPKWLIPAPAVAIIGREITMSAFREWASSAGGDAHKAVAVNNLGKWKTAAQMIAITALLLADAVGARTATAAALTGVATLWFSAALALASLGVYMKGALPYLMR